MSDIIDINEIKKILQQFATIREWNKFHTPKNLAMALAAESGELLEIFQWLNEAESISSCHHTSYRERTRNELADIIIYAIRIADMMGINLNQAIHDKIAINNLKYPADLVKGSVEKYDEYHTD
jgi:NTP pyrophosphatase (non-canonical NTP hydrolase)